jgi:cysteine-rich repeat protein
LVVPAASNLRLTFDHWLATERGLDGGNLKYNVNGGAFSLVPAPAFRFNPYNAVLDPTANGSDDPLAGEAAFTGSDEGAVDGSWGPSQLALGALAPAGATVRFRFELGLDGCGGLIGWYVDDVAAVACGNCGNALLDAGESCDDGDFAGGDGCSATCQVESGWSCSPPVPPIPDADRVADGGFEGGTPNAAWDEASTNFGTPLCAGCAVGASEGAWLAWFGGSTVAEAASLEQTVLLPADADTLRFDLWVGVCDSTADALRLLVDGSELFDSGSCAPTSGYEELVVDLGGFADGGSHLLRLEAVTAATNGGPTNFFVDRVTIPDPGVPGVPSLCVDADLFSDDFESGDVSAWSSSSGFVG